MSSIKISKFHDLLIFWTCHEAPKPITFIFRDTKTPETKSRTPETFLEIICGEQFKSGKEISMWMLVEQKEKLRIIYMSKGPWNDCALKGMLLTDMHCLAGKDITCTGICGFFYMYSVTLWSGQRAVFFASLGGKKALRLRASHRNK